MGTNMVEFMIQEAREKVDKALCGYIEALGYDSTDFDYSNLNDLLDEMEGSDNE